MLQSLAGICAIATNSSRWASQMISAPAVKPPRLSG